MALKSSKSMAFYRICRGHWVATMTGNLHLLFILLYLSVCSIWRSWNLTTSSCFEKKKEEEKNTKEKKITKTVVHNFENVSGINGILITYLCLHEKIFSSFLTINIILAWNCSKRLFSSNWSSSRSVSPKSRRKWFYGGPNVELNDGNNARGTFKEIVLYFGNVIFDCIAHISRTDDSVWRKILLLS